MSDSLRTFIVSSSKPSTCVLDAAPIRLFKDIFKSNQHARSRSDQVDLIFGWRTKDFQVVKPRLRKPNLDPDVLANYRLMSNILFSSKIIKNEVANQLCEPVLRNGVFEEFQEDLEFIRAQKQLWLKLAMIF